MAICSKLLELAATDDVACFKDQVEIMGCDVDELSYWYGRTFGSSKMGYEERSPIMIASLYGSIDVLDYIIQTGQSDINRACGSDQATALHCAAASGSMSSVEVVKRLIEAGGNIGIVDANGKKPGDLIAPSVKFSSDSNRKMLEMLLNGFVIEEKEAEEEEKTPRYPIDLSMPDLSDDLFAKDDFRMYVFKVQPCSRAYSHDWTECPFVHPGENARRRDPRMFSYTCVPCPDFKRGVCTKGDYCEYAHGIFESWLHPAQYRTRLCKESGCTRKVCFFAHKQEELRPLNASTGSAMPSPKSTLVNTLETTTPSPLSLGLPSFMMNSSSNSPISTSAGSSWQNKLNPNLPNLQIPGSRLKASSTANEISTRELLDELTSMSSPYSKAGNLNPTNLSDIYNSFDQSTRLANLQSPMGLQNRPNLNQLPTTYSSYTTSYGFDSSAAVINSRSSSFANRSQSFVDRSGGNYRASFPGSNNTSSPMIQRQAEWGSHDRKVDWGFNGEDFNKLTKSASFGLRNGNMSVPRQNVGEPDVSWVNTMVQDVPSGVVGMYRSERYRDLQQWDDQVYIEEQMVA